MLCQVFKSKRNPEMYLYVDKSVGLTDVPAPLLKRFGDAEPLMVVLLGEGKKLARANPVQVVQEITDNGFYLQMPPTTAELLRREGVNRVD
ncbi:UNVERIFIED_CONTAM: hypothetical protein GTU68_009725 [Idotea baltica]|nr:hypothetical protein [Idotea baltica]